MEDCRVWDESQLRKYNLKLEPIPRLAHDDPKVDELIAANVRKIFIFLSLLCVIKCMLHIT